jgi:alginate O-acetyltransferase complex protein AlgI
LVAERLLKNVLHIKSTNWALSLLLAFLTFNCVNVTWVFFRAKDFTTALNLLGSMFFIHGEKPILMTDHLVLVGGLMTLVFLGHFAMRNHSIVDVIEKSPQWLLLTAWSIMLFGLMIVQTSGQQFIYFQF